MAIQSVRRVLVVASTFPAAPADASPAFVRDLMLALKTAHPEVAFAVLAPQVGVGMSWHTRHEEYDEFRFAYAWPRSAQRLTGRGILPALRREPWLVALVPFLFRGEHVALRRLVREWIPDVIHAHWFTPQGIVAAMVSKETGVPMVLTTHASDVSIWARIPLLGTSVVRRWFPRAARITAVSKQTLDRARQFFTDAEWEAIRPRTAIIPMGVTPVAADHAHLPSATRTVLFLGRFAEKKGIPFLIDAVARLARKDIKLVIAGTGPEKRRIEAQVQRAGLADRVLFPGFVTAMQKARLIASADVIAVPSIDTSSGDSEGLPVVILEALAAGVPCVATDASGAGEVMEHGVHGWLVPQRDPAALAAAIDTALALDADARARLRHSARARAREFAWPQVARRHWDFLFANPDHIDC